MPSTQALLLEIDTVFPPVPKPDGAAVSFHATDCLQCQFVRQDIEKYSDVSLPDDAIRYLHNELSCLSATAWRWALPSYLRRCVTQDAEYDAVETEFLIYNLGPEESFKDETRLRLSALSEQQVRCLLHFLEWCRDHPHWSEYCAEDVSRAATFIASILAERDAA
jgi:hypothetical protein